MPPREFPMLSVYGYRAYSHYERNKSLYIHRPDMSLSTAENILRMLRPDKKFTKLEALVLDIALVLHMEHGGGNNSTFTTRVVTSSGSDTYSVMAAALCSLKGPKHGGANIKVQQMMKDLKKHVKDTSDVDEIVFYLSQLLNKEAFVYAAIYCFVRRQVCNEYIKCRTFKSRFWRPGYFSRCVFPPFKRRTHWS